MAIATTLVIAGGGPVAAGIFVVRDEGGITTLTEDAIAVSLLSVVGALLGAAPIEYTRWVLRVLDAAERRVADEH